MVDRSGRGDYVPGVKPSEFARLTADLIANGVVAEHVESAMSQAEEYLRDSKDEDGNNALPENWDWFGVTEPVLRIERTISDRYDSLEARVQSLLAAAVTLEAKGR
jgi:hypothetical protein